MSHTAIPPQSESQHEPALQEIFFQDGVRDRRGCFALGKGMQTGINLQAANVVLAVPPHVQGE